MPNNEPFAKQARMEGEKNLEVVFMAYAKGWASEENVSIRQVEMPKQPKAGSRDVLLKNLWISLDPFLRGRMQEKSDGLYLPPFQIGKPLVSMAVSKIVASDHPHFKAGEFVTCVTSVSKYSLAPAGDGLEKVDPNVAPLSHYLGILGNPGMTAWYGLNVIASLKPSDSVYVTAASGVVGLAVGQLAKSKGCRVVGSVGSDEKAQLLKTEFGFDDAFNYKKERDWHSTLARLFPNGIDVYFENVGGRMLEAVLNHINMNGRIAVCGMVSQYNQEWSEREGVRNLLNLVGKCVKMEGFLVGYNNPLMPKFLEEVTPLMKTGKLKYKEHWTKGIENFLMGFNGMLKGGNVGKALIHVQDA